MPMCLSFAHDAVWLRMTVATEIAMTSAPP
jgi:hypothetical protein